MGILGGIGSGKSSVIRSVDGISFRIIDGDRIGHNLLTTTKIQTLIRREFGDDVFQDGTVDRSLLAQQVFGSSPQHKHALKTLNQILHPAIRAEIHTQIRSAHANTEAVILDAALLLEGGWDDVCDWLIYIDTPQDIRQQRVIANRGWPTGELQRREANQWDLKTKRNRADFVVDNSGSVENSATQMKQIFRTIFSNSIRTGSQDHPNQI